MKKQLLLLTTALLLTSPAWADDGTETTLAKNMYLSVMGGYAKTEATMSVTSYYYNPYYGTLLPAGTQDVSEKFDTYIGAIEGGRQITDYFRLGCEAAYRYIDLNGYDGKFHILTTSLQAYADLHNQTPFTPYLNAGAGLATSWSNIEGDKTEHTFTWNIGAGIYTKLSDSVGMDVRYRYVDFGKVRDDLDISAKANEFMVGFRFNF